LRGWLNSNWLDALITVLVAVIEIAILTPWILLLLLSTGETSLNPLVPIGAGVIGVVSFWVARELLSKEWDMAAMRMTSLGVWLAMLIVWFGLVTDAGLAAPFQLIDRLFSAESAAFGLLFLAGVAWWRGLWLASTEDVFEAEFIRSAMLRTVAAQGLVLIFSSFFWEEITSPVRSLAAYMIPLGFGACLIAATAVQIRGARLNIREQLDQRLPGRGWLAAGAGMAAGILLIAALIAGTAGREIWQIVIWPLSQLARGAGWVLDWIVLGLAVIGYFLLLPIFWLVQQLIADQEEEDHVQEFADEPVFEFDDLTGQANFVPESVLQVMQWVVVAIVIGLVIWFAMRQLQRLQNRKRDQGETEVRESIWSRDAVMDDLGGFLQGLRGRIWSRRSRFNLRRRPDSVREAYQNVIVHAGRQGVPREPTESPGQFGSRLKTSEPGVSDPVDDLTERYLRARYGDLTSEEDIQIAREDWDAIRQRLRRQRTSES
jgi:hypothetical protein